MSTMLNNAWLSKYKGKDTVIVMLSFMPLQHAINIKLYNKTSI